MVVGCWKDPSLRQLTPRKMGFCWGGKARKHHLKLISCLDFCFWKCHQGFEGDLGSSLFWGSILSGWQNQNALCNTWCTPGRTSLKILHHSQTNPKQTNESSKKLVVPLTALVQLSCDFSSKPSGQGSLFSCISTSLDKPSSYQAAAKHNELRLF